MEDIPTFVTDEDLVRVVVNYGLFFVLSITCAFLGLYRYALWRRIREENKKRKDLTNIEHRSNGHHKKKVEHE